MPRNFSINELRMISEANERHTSHIELQNKLAEAQREIMLEKEGMKLLPLDGVFATPSAGYDLNAICEKADDDTVSQLYAGMKSLAVVPLRHPIVRDDNLAKQGFRMFDVCGYAVYYIVGDGRVVVCRVLETRGISNV